MIATEAHARATDPETSQEAAESVRNITQVHERILDLLREQGPLTDEALIRHYGFWYTPPTDQSIRSRRAELVKAGKVVFSGLYGLTKTGRRSREWAVAS